MSLQDRSVIAQALALKYSELNTTGFTPEDFLSALGSPVDAMMYLYMFWPEFVEYDNMVFLRDVVDTDEIRRGVDDMLSKYSGNRHCVERSFNTVDVPCMLFGAKSHESSEEIDALLTKMLVELWRCKLQCYFPARVFNVEAIRPEENGDEWGITFYSLDGDRGE